MQTKSDKQLLREYAEHGSEGAFGELVSRHSDLVYSAALRQVGSADSARDIAQSVFTDLARKAPSLGRRLPEGAMLVGWLYRGTRYAALAFLRKERRRCTREREAMQLLDQYSEPEPDWGRLGSVLDEAMALLGEKDRDTLLLRFFKNEGLLAVGGALGVSGDAAQKRVTRALEKLRDLLERRGIKTTSALLSAVLAANAVQSAPAGLAAALTSASLAGAAAGTTFTLLQLMAISKFKVGVVSAVIVAAGIATSIIVQRQANAKLREGLQQQTQEIASLREENRRLASLNVNARELAPDPESLRPESAAKTNAPLSNAPKVEESETPDAPFVPIDSLQNVGIATWTDALQTFFWATAKKDTNVFANAVIWDPDAKARMERFLAATPQSVRQRFGSVDGLLYSYHFEFQQPLVGYRVTHQAYVYDKMASFLVESQRSGGARGWHFQFTLRRDNDGWRIVLGGAGMGEYLVGAEEYLKHLGASNQAHDDK
jgi:RNA polymerase sigma factor (sigma-70 family)